MSNCRKHGVNNRCGTVEQKEQTTIPCDPFEVCIGFGRTLYYDGRCMKVTGNPTVPDGWYGRFRLENGCLVEAEDAPVPSYTPGPCAPAAGPCGDDTGTGGDIPISGQPGNLITMQADGLFAGLSVIGNGIEVTGYGTPGSPLRLTVSGGDGAGIFSNSATLNVQGSGATLQDAFNVELKPILEQPQTYAGISFDRYGRATGYEAPAAGGVAAVIGGSGIDASTDPSTNIVTLALGKTMDDGAGGTFKFGGYNVEVATDGRVYGVSRQITLNPATYTLGGYDVTVDSTGSITAIEAAGSGGEVRNNRIARQTSGGVADVTLNTTQSGRLKVTFEGHMPAFDGGTGVTPRSTEDLTINGINIPFLSYSMGGTCQKIVGVTQEVVDAGSYSVQITGADGAGMLTVELVD